MTNEKIYKEWESSNGTIVQYTNINIGVINRIMALYQAKAEEIEIPYVNVSVGTQGATEKQIINQAYVDKHPEHADELIAYNAKLNEIEAEQSEHFERLVMKVAKIPDDVNMEEWREEMIDFYGLTIPDNEIEEKRMWLETVAFPDIINDLVAFTTEVTTSQLSDGKVKQQIAAMFRGKI